MTKLAINGGEPEVKGPIKPYNSIDDLEMRMAQQAMGGPLSGFLGGEPFGGYYVNRLEAEWAAMFKVRYAIAVNSATSGLLAAAHACGLGRDTEFLVSPFTMSATAAAPALLGAEPVFVDIDPRTFLMSPGCIPEGPRDRWRAVITTSLFGSGQDEGWWKGWADQVFST